MSQQTTRRRFLKRSLEGAAVTAAISSLGGVHSAVAEEPAALNIGIIGCGVMMDHHVKRLASFHQNVSITWLCDVDPSQIDRRAIHLNRLKLKTPRKTSRYEDVVLFPAMEFVTSSQFSRISMPTRVSIKVGCSAICRPIRIPWKNS